MVSTRPCIPKSALLDVIDLRIWLLEACVATVAWAAWQRPQGWSSDAVEVRESRVHGKGVFAVRDIREGEKLGGYPGLVRTAEEVRAAPRVACETLRTLCWCSRSHKLLSNARV